MRPSRSTLICAWSPLIVTSSMRPPLPSASRKVRSWMSRKPSGAASGIEVVRVVIAPTVPAGVRSTRSKSPRVTMLTYSVSSALNTRPSIPLSRSSCAKSSRFFEPGVSLNILPLGVSETYAVPSRAMVMSLQTEAGGGNGYTLFCFPVRRLNAISAAVPTAGGLRKGFGDEQSHKVPERSSVSTPSSDSSPFCAVGLIQGSAFGLPGLARKTMPLMLPM